jgi:hypothetical protein
VLLALLALAAPARGQEIEPGFRAQMAMADAAVFQGRIVSRMARLQQWATTTSSARRGSETLRFERNDHGTAMHYKLVSPQRKLVIDADADYLLMERVSFDGDTVTAEARYEQEPGKPIQFRVLKDGQAHVLEADTVWHLWLEDPQLCSENLLPLCEMLGMRMPWQQFTQALELKLLQMVETGQTPDQDAWQAWLRELSDPRFAVREAADRRFRAAGTAVLPFIRGLDSAELDAEQRYRLRRIAYELQGEATSDTVDAVAESLLQDPRAWVEMLDRGEASDRSTAAAQLERLLRAEVDFDPDGDDAARNASVGRLRNRVRGVVNYP